MIYFTVYGPYTGAGEYMAVMTVSSSGNKFSQTTLVALDLERMIFNYAGLGHPMSIEGEELVCSHSWEEAGTTHVSCTVDGQTHYRCAWCGASKSEITEHALGHVYGEDDRCNRCGSMEPIRELKDQTLAQMEQEWNRLQGYNGVTEEYGAEYQSYVDDVKNADSIAAIENAKVKFFKMRDKIREEFSKYVEEISLKEDRIKVLLNTDWETFLSEYLAKNGLSVRFNTGEVTTVALTEDMLRPVDELRLDRLGEYLTIVEYERNGQLFQYFLRIEVVPDMEGASLVGKYDLISSTEEEDPSGIVTLTLYDNGVLQAGRIDGAYYYYNYEMKDGILSLSWDIPLLFTLNDEKGTATYYEGESELITLYAESPEQQVIVYGPYDVAGLYPAKLMTYWDDGDGMRAREKFTTLVYLDLENREFELAWFFENRMTFDEIGFLDCKHSFPEGSSNRSEERRGGEEGPRLCR
jgi:hypothetical protein